MTREAEWPEVAKPFGRLAMGEGTYSWKLSMELCLVIIMVKLRCGEGDFYKLDCSAYKLGGKVFRA